MGFWRRFDYEERFNNHPIGAREITGLRLSGPVPLQSGVAQMIIESGIVSFLQAAEPTCGFQAATVDGLSVVVVGDRFLDVLSVINFSRTISGLNVPAGQLDPGGALGN